MAPPCKKFTHKRKGRREPVVKTTESNIPSSHPVSSSNSNESQPVFDLGEGECGEVEERKPEKTTFERLKDWVKMQKFIPKDLSDDFLILFLSAAGYSLELAAEKINKYFRSRQEPSFLFTNRDPASPENIEILKKLYVIPMPGTTDDGKKVILTGLVEPALSYNQLYHVKALAMVIDLLIWENNFSFGEFAIVLDGRGFECPQLLENKVHNHRTIKSLLLDTIPGVLRSFYFLCPPFHVANVADSRNGIWITVVKTKNELVNHIPGNILPLEYGGHLGPLRDLLGKWELHMFKNRRFFVSFEKRMLNDHRRKLCYENELKNRGKNWVQDMKLEADESDYKIQYYERMKNMTPLEHPAFGSKRSLIKRKEKPPVDSLRRCKERAKAEAEKARLYEPSRLYNGYVREIRKARMEDELEKWKKCCALSPVLELEIFCP